METFSLGFVSSFSLPVLRLVSGLRAVVVLISTVSFSLYAEELEQTKGQCDLSQPVMLSSINHPKIQQYFEPLIKKTYADIGVNVDFVVTSSYRDLMLVNREALSGSVAFAEDIIDTIPGLIKVAPPLSIMSYMLVCKKGKPCNLEQLHKLIEVGGLAVTNAMSMGVVTNFPQIDKDNLVIVSKMGQVLSMLSEGRVDYGVYPVSDRSKGGTEEIPVEFNYEPMYDIATYHVINNNLLCLLPKIEASLSQNLKTFK